jgi:hypothetical protein
MRIGRLMNHLDAVSFLRIDIWDFCCRSLFKEYGFRFFSKAVLSHPVKTLKGLIRYRTFLMTNSSSQDSLYRSPAENNVLLKKMRGNPSNLLVGLGFCLKPFHSKKPNSSCPSGRANHDCIYLDKGETRPVCSSCAIFKISVNSLERDFRVYIMTSAEDMARDFLIPQIVSEKFPLSLLFLCPYSVQAILPALFICGAESFFVPYSKGNCKNYEQWRKADLGHKEEVTELDSETWEKVLDIFEHTDIAEPRPRSFKRVGNIFFPRSEAISGSAPQVEKE